jgi:hypothetical protein
MLHSADFNKVMKLLAKQYDRVIVDSPPVLPVTDAQILASICQITILVLRAEKSTRKASKQACDALLRVGAQIPGVVVNDVPKNGRFGYSGGNGYYTDSSSSRRMIGFQKSDTVGKRRELCARLGNSASQRIVEIASPKKKIVAADRKPAAVSAASDKTENKKNSGSKNIAEKQTALTERKKAVRKHKEPAEAYDCT